MFMYIYIQIKLIFSQWKTVKGKQKLWLNFTSHNYNNFKIIMDLIIINEKHIPSCLEGGSIRRVRGKYSGRVFHNLLVLGM